MGNPEWDKQPVVDSALYIIDKIRPEIEKGNLRIIYRYVNHLDALIRFASIVEERFENPPIIIFPPEV